MLKFLMLGSIAYFVSRLLASIRRGGKPAAPVDGARAETGGANGGAPRRRMVKCDACGVYVLEERALAAPGGAVACSPACAASR